MSETNETETKGATEGGLEEVVETAEAVRESTVEAVITDLYGPGVPCTHHKTVENYIFSDEKVLTEIQAKTGLDKDALRATITQAHADNAKGNKDSKEFRT